MYDITGTVPPATALLKYFLQYNYTLTHTANASQLYKITVLMVTEKRHNNKRKNCWADDFFLFDICGFWGIPWGLVIL